MEAVINQRIVCAVGLAKPPSRVGDTAERALKRIAARIIFGAPLRTDDRNALLRKAYSLIHTITGRNPFLIRGGSIGDTFENDLMKLIFQATAISNVADNAATSPLTNLSVALHTADPGEAGNQTTSESAYTSYARVSVARTSGGWTVTANSVSPVSTISFPAGTGGSGTVTYFSVGPTGGGSTKIMFSGTVTPNIVTGNGVTPQLTTATAITID